MSILALGASLQLTAPAPVATAAATERAPVEARAATSAPPAAPAPAPLAAYLEPIVERNLFDSAASEKEQAPPEPQSTAPQESESKARLVSTSVASDPAWSSCLIATDPKGPVSVYRIGDEVLGTVIEDIQRGGVDGEGKRVAGRVFLRGRSGVEFLVVDNPPPKKVVKKKRKRRKRIRSRRRRSRRR